MKTYRLAVVGATGMVGQTFIQVLQERKFPIQSIDFFASSKSVGKEIVFNGEKHYVLELNEHSFDSGYDFALFSAGGKISLKYAEIAANKGAIVIDNSSAWRMSEKHQLIVPEVNASVLTISDKIIANPNCSTIQAMMPLKIINDLFSLKRVIYNTYQAVSGSGYQGIMDYERTIKGETPLYYLKPIFGNVIPHIDDFLESGYTKEEQKMMDETRKILNLKDLLVTATCVRVPVMNGHSVSVNVECHQKIDLDLLKKEFVHKGIVFYDKDYPTPLDVTGLDTIHVGRLRLDQSVENGLNFWVVADNIRKGAATNAIQIAEYLIEAMKGDI